MADVPRRRATGHSPSRRRPSTPFRSPAASPSRSAGCKADLDGRVLDKSGDAIPGLFAGGEMLGGLFSGNYPGGSGLAAGIVFGRRAGTAA